MKHEKMYVLILGVVALSLTVAAISTENWSKTTASKGNVSMKVNMGLWKACSNIGGTEKCKEIPAKDDDDKKNFKKVSLDVCRAFSIIAALMIFIGMMSALSGVRHSCLFFIFGGISALIAMGVWAGEMLRPWSDMPKSQEMKVDYSFFLLIAGGVVALLAGLVCWRAPKMNMKKSIPN